MRGSTLGSALEIHEGHLWGQLWKYMRGSLLGSTLEIHEGVTFGSALEIQEGHLWGQLWRSMRAQPSGSALETPGLFHHSLSLVIPCVCVELILFKFVLN